MPNSELDEKSIFNAAREIDSQDARREYVRRRCGDDVAQFDRVTALLQGFEKDSQFLELQTVDLLPPVTGSPAIERPEAADRPLQNLRADRRRRHGRRLPRRAEQNPSAAQVALKIIKPGMDSKEVTRPFRSGTAGAGNDVASQHRQDSRRRNNRRRSTLLRDGTGQRESRSRNSATSRN